MFPSGSPKSTEDRVTELVASFQARCLRGETLDWQSLVAEYPEFADQLRRHFLAAGPAEATAPQYESNSTQPCGNSTCISEGSGETITLARQPGTAAETCADPVANSGLPVTAAADHTASRQSQFGDYELLEQVARGGMGVVFKARQRSLNRIVAVKMILAGNLASRDDVDRFRAEAEVAASLQHPNIVAIHNVGELHGQHFFSMDFVAGRSLKAIVRETLLSNRQAARYVSIIADAIHYAHEKGVLHRDLKPSNVLIDANDQPRITDFGLARRVAARSQLTVTGDIMGTPSYMPPEQAAARHGEAGPPSDVYSLGAILYELVTGRAPFRAETAFDTLWQVMHAVPVAPRLLNPRVDRDLETICLKCLQKEPARRYSSARALADDLRRYLNGEPIRARPTGALHHLWRWCRRNPLPASLATSIAILITVIAVGATVMAVKLRGERNAALDHLQRAERAEADARRASIEASERLWESNLAHARAIRWSGRAGRRFESLEALHRAADLRPTPEVRDEAIACMALPDLRVARQWPLSPRGAVAIDPLYERYAVFDDAGNISLRQIADGAEICRLPGDGNPAWVVFFSPNGRYLAAKHHPAGRDLPNRFVVWNLERGEVLLTAPSGLPNAAADFSPDSRYLAVAQEQSQIVLYDLATAAEHLRLESGLPPHTIRFHPGGQRVAVSSLEAPYFRLLDLQNEGATLEVDAPAAIRGIAWSPDGTQMAGACADHHVYLWDESGTRLQSLEGHTNVVTTVTFSRRGHLLASYGWDGSTRLWDVFTGRQHVAILGEIISGTPFSPDDRQLGFKLMGREFGIWEVEPADECLTVGSGTSADISPDGQFLAAVESDGLWIRDLRTSRVVAHLDATDNLSVHWERDGRNLLLRRPTALERLPLEFEAATGNQEVAIRFGSPQTIFEPVGYQIGDLAVSGDGHSAAVEARHQGHPIWIDLQDGTAKLLAGQHAGFNLFLAISPDGRWIASGTWQGQDVFIWDTVEGRAVRTLAVPQHATVAFSPNGRWLVSSTGQEYRFWNTATWEPAHGVPRDRAGDLYGRMAFSSDGRLLAIMRSRDSGLEILDSDTGHVVAKLEGWEKQAPYCFSRDTTQLIVGDGKLLQCWDLSRIRLELRRLHLDWGT